MPSKKTSQEIIVGIMTGKKDLKESSKKEDVKELSEAFPGEGNNKQGITPQGSSKKSKWEKLEAGSGGGKTMNKSSAPLAAGSGEFESKPKPQGSSKEAEVENLGKDDIGKKVAAKVSKTTRLPVGRGAGAAPNFKTVVDPTSEINKSSSKGNVMRGEETEHDEVVELTDEEYEALSDEEKAELVPFEDDQDIEEEKKEENSSEVIEEKKEDKKEKKEDKKDDDKKDDKKDDDKDDKKKFPFTKKEEVETEVKALFASDTELSEEFKTKAASLFEAVVTARVALEVEKVRESLAEESAKMFEEAKEEMVSNIDAYLTEVVAEWLNENEVGVVDSLRAEIAEDFIAGQKELFATHFIEVPEEKYDVLADQAEKIVALEATIQEQTETAEALAEELDTLKKNAIISYVTEGMAATEVEKFNEVVSKVTFEDEKTFTEKMNVIKEQYFPKAKKTKEVVEDVIEEKSPAMARYVDTLKRSLHGGSTF